MFKKSFSVFFMILSISAALAQGLIIDHTCTDLSRIPEEYIHLSKNVLRIGYGHTSHGSQLMTGIHAFRGEFGELFYFEYTGWGLKPGVFINDYWGNAGGASDLGHNGDLAWHDATVAMLNLPSNDRNVVIWSWCGGVSDNTESGINTYLSAMNLLETQYPEVTFVYMTGHLDGSGIDGNLHNMNEHIRQYCRTNNKVLFDFADIESYDPDRSVNFNQLYATDGCDYDSNGDGNPWGDGNWASEWLAVNPDSELAAISTECDSCAHSMELNCVLKGRAFWWMMARLAGWDDNEENPDENSISLITPHAQDVLSPGWNYTISWRTTGEIDRVNIYCSASDSASWNPVVSGTENDGSYSWKAPYNASSSWRIKIEDSDETVSDTSDCFAIRRYFRDDSIYIPTDTDAEVMLSSTQREAEGTLETFVVNLLENPVVFQIKALDTNGFSKGERTVTIEALGKVKLDTQWTNNLSTDFIQCERCEGLAYFSRVISDTSAISAYLNQNVSEELTIVHIAEESHYWNTHVFFSNSDRVDTLVSACGDDLIHNPVFSSTIDFEQYFDVMMTDVYGSWGTLTAETYFTPERTEILTGFELFVTETGDGGAVELLSSPSDVLYIPHIPEETNIFWTGLAFLNRSSESQWLTVTFYTDEGEKVGDYPLEVLAGGKVKGVISDLFPEAEENGRWGVVHCSGEGVFGIELYGTLNAGICGFSLCDTLSDNLLLPLMLTGEEQWTGIALVNPWSYSNDVEISLINGTGTELGRIQKSMNSQTRIKGTVTEFFPDIEISDNCYIRIQAQYPVTAVTAAGDSEFRTMHALPMRDMAAEY